MKAIPRLPFFILHSAFCILFLSACASRPTSHYPIPVLLDPVTEEVPNVRR